TGGNDAAAAELHQPSLADELARRIEREMARRAVELELQGCSVRERMGHAECVHSERVEALERWIGIVGTLLGGECHAAGVGEPRDLDKAHVVEIAHCVRRLALVDLAA